MRKDLNKLKMLLNQNNLIILLLVCSFAKISLSQDEISSNEPIILQNADSLVGFNSSEPYRNYIGNVRFTQGEVKVSSDFAKHFIEQNKAIMRGGVRLDQKSLSLFSERVDYNGNSKIAESKSRLKLIDGSVVLEADSGLYYFEPRIAEFSGNISVEDDTTLIFSDFLLHHRKDAYSLAEGNAAVFEKYAGAFLVAGRIENIPAKNFSAAYSNPKLFRLDSAFRDDEFVGFDTLAVSSDTMYSFRGKEKKYIFDKNVVFAQNDLFAQCDSSVYFGDIGLIKLFKAPILWYENSQITADSIMVYFSKNSLDSIIANGNALSVSKSMEKYSDRIDQISGNDIIIKMKNSNISFLESIGKARSLYFMYTEDEFGDGLIKHSADRIEVDFSDDDIEDINWLNNVTGEMYPEKQVYNKEKEFNLTKFDGIKAIPKKAQFDNTAYKKFQEYRK